MTPAAWSMVAAEAYLVKHGHWPSGWYERSAVAARVAGPGVYSHTAPKEEK